MTRVLLVSLDGATVELCERWMAEDRMPALRSIVQDGIIGPMRSTFPFNSGVAWTSMATGASAGRHGVYDFLLLRDDHYRLRPASPADRLVPAIWNRVSDAGGRVGVINVPVTYPTESVNGVMVSGIDSAALDERAVHPAAFLSRLRRISPGYRIISKAAHRARMGDWPGVERELLDITEARAAVALDLARSRDLDLLILNLETTEKAHHFFWHHHDPTHPRHDPKVGPGLRDAIGRIYQAADHALGALLDAYQPDTVFALSDRGAGPSRDWVLYLNDWLIARGFMTLRNASRAAALRRAHAALVQRVSVPARRKMRSFLGSRIDQARGVALWGGVDWPSTRAYAQLRSSLRVNMAGREPSGAVPEDLAADLLDEIRGAAQTVSLPDGEPVFPRIRSAGDVYEGNAPGGPDLILFYTEGMHIKPRSGGGPCLRRVADIPSYLPSGVHTEVGMISAAGRGIASRGRCAEADIHQVAPSLAAILGIGDQGMDAPLPFVLPLTPWTAGSRHPPAGRLPGDGRNES